MFNINGWIGETDQDVLYLYFDELLKKSGFKVLTISKHYFQPYGFTCLWLLSESHFAIHTFPEESKTYIELTSCVKAQFDNFVKMLQYKIGD